MTTYLSVGARYIQSWLAATPRLRLLRGASLAIECRTNRPAIQAWLDEQDPPLSAGVADDAGDISGVVVLTVTDPAQVADVAAALLVHLQEVLPGVEWAGWWEHGDTYIEAYSRQAHADAGERPFTMASLPVVNELGLLRSCPGCRREPARRGKKEDDLEPEQAAYGARCSALYDLNRRLRDAQGIGSEPGLVGHPREWLFEVLGPSRRWQMAQDFDELARNGGAVAGDGRKRAIGRKESRNHLAHVVADGNRMGALFDAILAAGPALGEFRRNAVRLIDDGIRQAVAGAAEAVTIDETPVNVIEPHYVGGDDVLVTVPAVDAWWFATRLIVGFSGLQDELAALLPPDLPDDVDERLRHTIAGLSLGAGLVFAHASHPFAHCAEVGHRALAKAKADTRGLESAVCFTDLTVDARGSEDAMYLVKASDLHPEIASGLLGLDAAARARLGDIVHGARATGVSAGVLSDQLAKHAQRIGREGLLDVEDPYLDVPALLTRARWWPSSEVTP